MTRRLVAASLLGLLVAGVAASCDKPRKEKGWERITRLRLHYKVAPEWYEMQKDKDGKPVLAMKLTITNSGPESLPQVTMVLHVTAPDGKDRFTAPLTLDVSHLSVATPGTVSVTVPGVEVRPGEEVVLQMEGQPSRAAMRAYPEFKGVS